MQRNSDEPACRLIWHLSFTEVKSSAKDASGAVSWLIWKNLTFVLSEWEVWLWPDPVPIQVAVCLCWEVPWGTWSTGAELPCPPGSYRQECKRSSKWSNTIKVNDFLLVYLVRTHFSWTRKRCFSVKHHSVLYNKIWQKCFLLCSVVRNQGMQAGALTLSWECSLQRHA